MMRKLSLVALLTGASFLAFTGAAAASSVSLVWTSGAGGVISGLGTSDITVSSVAAATLTLDVQVTVDSNGFGSGELDFEFDLGPGFDNELNIQGWSELAWANAKGNRALNQISVGIVSTQESTAAQEGQLFGFEAFTLGTGPVNTTLTFARLVFVTNPANVATDGDDIFNTTERDPGLGMFANDGFTDFSGGTGAISASVNIIPEPGTLALLSLGVGALALAGRRRRA